MNKFQKLLVTAAGAIVMVCLAVGIGGVIWWFSGGSNTIAQGGFSLAAAGTSTATLAATPPAPPAGITTAPTLRAGATSDSATNAPRVGGSFGIVQAVGTMTLTVVERGQTETINLLPQARVWYASKPAATVSDIQPGDKLLAIGVTRSGQTFARALLVAPAAYNADNILIGQIKSATGTSVVVTTPRGDRTVIVDASTRIVGQTLDSQDSSALPRGVPIVVIGQPGDSALQAQIILASPRPAVNNPAARGTPTPGN